MLGTNEKEEEESFRDIKSYTSISSQSWESDACSYIIIIIIIFLFVSTSALTFTYLTLVCCFVLLLFRRVSGIYCVHKYL